MSPRYDPEYPEYDDYLPHYYDHFNELGSGEHESPEPPVQYVFKVRLFTDGTAVAEFFRNRLESAIQKFLRHDEGYQMEELDAE